MKIVFHPEAYLEMLESARFYEDREEGLGLRFLQAVEDTTQLIQEFPHAGLTESSSLEVIPYLFRRHTIGTAYSNPGASWTPGASTLKFSKLKRGRNSLVKIFARLSKCPVKWNKVFALIAG